MDLEKCILDSFNYYQNSDPATQKQALETIEKLKASPDCWEYGLQLLLKQPQSIDQVRFFALQLIESALCRKSVPVNVWMSSIAGPLVTYLTSTVIPSYERFPVFLRNKLAQIFSILFTELYISDWPEFFRTFSALLKTNDLQLASSAFDIYVRIVMAVDEEIASVYVQRSNEIHVKHSLLKDTMRSRDIDEIVKTLSSMMVGQSDVLLRQNIEIVRICVILLGRMSHWISISLVTTAPLLGEYFKYLGYAELQRDTVSCLSEFVSKGMLPKEKYEFIYSLDIPSLIPQLKLVDVEAAESTACLINTVGIELCLAYEKCPSFTTRILDLIERILPFLFQYFSHEYDDVTCQLIPFALQYVNVIKKLKEEYRMIPELQLNHLTGLLNVVILKLKYDLEEYNFDEPDEEEGLFQEMRKNLKVIFENILQMGEPLIHKFVQESIGKTFARVANKDNSLDASQVELALHLLFIYGERNYSFPADAPNPIKVLTVSMIQSDVCSFNHPAVVLQYFEIIVRSSQLGFYDNVLGVSDELLSKPLAAFLDQRGIHNPSKMARLRIWYLFLRWTKQIKTKLLEGVEYILTGLSDLLIVPPPKLATPISENVDKTGKVSKELVNEASSSGFIESLGCLFETAGILVSLKQLGVEKQINYISIVLRPFCAEMQSIMNTSFNSEENVQRLCDLILVLGSFCKGLPEFKVNTGSSGKDHPDFAPAFSEVFKSVLVVIEALSNMESIRKSAIFLFQRMVGCLGSITVPYLGPLLIGFTSKSGPSELASLISFAQVCLFRFKEFISEVISGFIGPLIAQSEFLLNSRTIAGTDDLVQIQNLKRSVVSFVGTIISGGFGGILLTDDNLPYFQRLLQLLVSQFVHEYGDPILQKMCFSLLNNSVNAFYLSEKQDKNMVVEESFGKFIYESVVPLTFRVPLNPNFNLDDASSLSTILEISTLSKALALSPSKGPQFLAYLENVYLPGCFRDPSTGQWKCDPSVLKEYMEALSQMEIKHFKSFYRNFVRGLRMALVLT